MILKKVVFFSKILVTFFFFSLTNFFYRIKTFGPKFHVLECENENQSHLKTFLLIKFWTKSLYMVRKILLAKKKKNIPKIFEKIQLFSKSFLRSAGGGTFRLHFRNLQKIWW